MLKCSAGKVSLVDRPTLILTATAMYKSEGNSAIEYINTVLGDGGLASEAEYEKYSQMESSVEVSVN